MEFLSCINFNAARMYETVIHMLSVISIICELQLWANGCPFGYLPTFDTNQGALYRTCGSVSDCSTNGAQCIFSPLTVSSICCTVSPSFAAPYEDVVYIYPYIGYQEPVTSNTTSITRPTTTTTATTTTITTTSRPSTTVSRIVNVTATASSTRTTIAPALLQINQLITTSPVVFQLVIGRYQPGVTTTNPSTRVGSVSLICDNGYNILVDSGINYRQSEMIAALASRGLQPFNIHTVILTHGHPDHFGGGSMFPNAQFIFGPYVYRGDQFIFSGLNQAPTVRLSMNCDMWNTPGHTPDSLTVVVKNVVGCGTVAVTGDLFISQIDLTTPSLWRDLAWDFTIQQQSRNLILCQVNWIVPGHGLMFQVTDEIKRNAGCPRPAANVQPASVAPANVPVYVGSSIPVVNPLNTPVQPVGAPVPQTGENPSAQLPPAMGIPPSPSVNIPNVQMTTPSQYMIYYNPVNKNQQKVIFTNQFGQPLSMDDQKFMQYQVQYSQEPKSGNSAYKILFPKKKKT